MIKKLIVIIALIALGLYVSNQLQQKGPVLEIPTEETESTAEITSEDTTVSEATTDVTAPAKTSAEPDPTSVEEGTVIDESLINEDQKELLERFGIDTSAITVTEEMITCAEEKVGIERLEEIKNGATPDFLEGLSLVTCY